MNKNQKNNALWNRIKNIFSKEKSHNDILKEMENIFTAEEKELVEKLSKQSDYIILPHSLQPDIFTEQMPNDKRKKMSRWKRFVNHLKDHRKLIVVMATAVVTIFTVHTSYYEIMDRKIEKNIVMEGELFATGFQSEGDAYYYLKKAIKENAEKVSFSDIINEAFSTGTVKGLYYVATDLSSSGTTDYIDTNIQTENVDEADWAKTDGQYIYNMNDNRISIYDVKKKQQIAYFDVKPDTEAGEESEEEWENSFYAMEMYVQDNKLIALGSGYEDTYVLTYDISGVDTISQRFEEKGQSSQEEEESLNIDKGYYDSDLEYIKKIGEVKQSGYYRSSRCVNGYVYLFTNYHIDDDEFGRNNFLPKVNGETIDLDKLYINAGTDEAEYIMVSSIDMNKPDEMMDYQVVCSGGFNEYVSNENIYIYGYFERGRFYESHKGKTSIVKFSFKDGEIDYEAYGKVQGQLNDSFSMDEYEGNLRVVTTSDFYGTDGNHVFVLDDKLKVIGSIKNIAEGEVIHSARFMGDTGYFVTYYQTDPVFSVDFSDPTNPNIIGELKVSGFSSYLHFWDDGLLLGIGEETNPQTGIFLGTKLSMFDINNPTNVTETAKEVLDYHESMIEYNHRSVMISPQKNIIGLATYYYNSSKSQEFVRYPIYEYVEEGENAGFHLLMMYELTEEEAGEAGVYWGEDMLRGIYIDGEIYLVIKGYNVKYLGPAR